MEIRAVQPKDIDALVEIDGTIESSQYLHLEQVQAEDSLSLSWKLEERPQRQKLIEPNRLDDEILFTAKQIASGADEGMALMAEHDDAPVALLVARPDLARGTYSVVDVRIDFEHRREGLGTALVFQVIAAARMQEIRAVSAETVTNNFPAIQLFRKLGFELSGVDTRYKTNHDVVKESATLFWYLPLT
jgi:ribosomal protein S18 acetylase RimI-like enzyme